MREEWAHVKLRNFNKAKCKGLRLRWGNPLYQLYQYRLKDEWLRAALQRRTLGYWRLKNWT